MQALKARAGRRRLLLWVASAGAAACGGGGTDTTPPPPCATPSDAGAGASYCIVERELVRVKGARKIAVGEALLVNVDDNTAVIVARDAGGYHAKSGVCTHACCLVSLCGDELCSKPTTNPGECGSTAAVTVPATDIGILCPCHGSGFRVADGSPTKGPAKKPLPSYTLSFDGDDALVDTSTVVDASTRV